MDEVDPERHHQLEKSMRALGQFVHSLTISLENGLANSANLPIYCGLPYMSNLRSLTVVHEREDCAPHVALHHVVDKFSQLENVTLREKDYDVSFDLLPEPIVEVTRTFFYHFLRTVLETHANRLESLHLFTLLPLHRNLFIKIRDGTPNLRVITFAGNIDEEVADDFEDSIPWASGRSGSFKDLTLLNCHLHFVRFARNVLDGVYGTRLTNVTLMACGTTDTSTLDTPPTSTPVHGSIHSLHFNHFNPWELSAMSLIPVRDLSLTRAHPHAFLELPTLLMKALPNTDRSYIAFRGLERLRLSPKLSSEDTWKELGAGIRQVYEDLKEACALRGIELSLDAVESTSSHDRVCKYIG